MLIFAIESSCDETAAALVKDGRQVLSDAVSSQIKIHAKYAGVGNEKPYPQTLMQNHK